ncbi:hypothetical protein [Candidatus Bealeia paramacronuclearis]
MANEEPRVLRAVTIKNPPRDAYPDFEGDFCPLRHIPGNFGFVDHTKFNSKIYQLTTPVGIFWNEQATNAFQAISALGIKTDFTSLSDGALIEKEKLKNTSIKISMKQDNTSTEYTIYKVNLLEALKSDPVGTDGVLYIDLKKHFPEIHS